MKKHILLTTAVLMISASIVLSGCSNNKIMKSLMEKGYFSNSYDNAISQTDIAGMISSHFESSTSKSIKKKKAILITIDGMRAEGLTHIMESDLGMSQISKDGGLYWTKPANLNSKAKVDEGVNFLSIVTGTEPSEFGVLKSTDVKRELPYSIMTKVAEKYNVKFLTDNKNYANKHLAEEFAAKQSQKLSVVTNNELNQLRADCLRSLDNNDFIMVAISNPYDVAAGNFKLSNESYLSAIIHLNYYISELYEQVELRATEDWLFVATTTCGGNSKLAANNEEGNILTFMFTNKAIED